MNSRIWYKFLAVVAVVSCAAILLSTSVFAADPTPTPTPPIDRSRLTFPDLQGMEVTHNLTGPSTASAKSSFVLCYTWSRHDFQPAADYYTDTTPICAGYNLVNGSAHFEIRLDNVVRDGYNYATLTVKKGSSTTISWKLVEPVPTLLTFALYCPSQSLIILDSDESAAFTVMEVAQGYSPLYIIIKPSTFAYDEWADPQSSSYETIWDIRNKMNDDQEYAAEFDNYVADTFYDVDDINVVQYFNYDTTYVVNDFCRNTIFHSGYITRLAVVSISLSILSFVFFGKKA